MGCGRWCMISTTALILRLLIAGVFGQANQQYAQQQAFSGAPVIGVSGSRGGGSQQCDGRLTKASPSGIRATK
jgi:hypothetical protein